MDSKKHLHGNKARIKPDISIAPRFMNFVSDNYRMMHGETVYLNPHDADEERAKAEVDANEL